jgi:hypothetical protein
VIAAITSQNHKCHEMMERPTTKTTATSTKTTAIYETSEKDAHQLKF